MTLSPFQRFPRPCRPRRRLPRALLAAGLLAASLASAALLSACARPRDPAPPVVRALPLAQTEVVGDLSLARDASRLQVVYTDPRTLSLELTLLDPPPPGADSCAVQASQTTSFDRVSDSVEVGPLFGNHVLLSQPGRLDLFYHDQQTDGRGLTKWAHRGSDDPQWWIDLLPLSGRLVAALPDAGQGVRLVYQDGQRLLVGPAPAPADSRTLLAPCETAARGAPVADDPSGSFTFFDSLSGRLYLAQDGPAGLSVSPLHAGAPVCHARLVAGRRVVVLHDPGAAALVAMEERPGAPGQYDSFKITPSERTSAVFFAEVNGSRFYLFDELDSAAAPERRYALALLYPAPPSAGAEQAGAPAAGASSGRQVRYGKTVLAAGPRPFKAWEALVSGHCLFVLCAQETLSLLSVPLDAWAPPPAAGPPS